MAKTDKKEKRKSTNRAADGVSFRPDDLSGKLVVSKKREKYIEAVSAEAFAALKI